MSFLKSTGKVFADIIPGLGALTFDDDMGKVFVTSGTGVIGYRVAMSLLAAGQKDVRVGIYKGEREVNEGDEGFVGNIANLLRQKGADVIDFDWTDPASVDNALSGGVKTIFCTLPHMDSQIDNFTAFVQKAKGRKIEHFVKVSFLHNDQYSTNVPFCAFHNSADDLLEEARKSSRISYTILATGHLMTTPLLTQGDYLNTEHKYVTASYGMGVDYVSPNDVADAAMVVLLNLKDHRNKVYNLTNVEPTTDRQVAAALSKAYGTKIQHIELGYHDYVEHLKTRKIPAWLAKDAAAFEKMKASGIDEDPHNYYSDMVKLVGRKPESFSAYLKNKASQRPGRKFGGPGP